MISIDRLLYALEQRYKVCADFYKMGEETVDVLTGKKEVTRIKYHISKAVHLQQKDGFKNPILFKPMSNIYKNSGLLDIEDVELLVRGKHFPKGVKPTTNDYFIIRHERYEIKHVQVVDLDQSYYFLLREFKGSKLHEIHERYIHDKLHLIQLLKFKHRIFWKILTSDVLEFTDSVFINYHLSVREFDDELEVYDYLQPVTLQHGSNYITYVGLKDSFVLGDIVSWSFTKFRNIIDTLVITDEVIRDQVIHQYLTNYLDIDQHLEEPDV